MTWVFVTHERLVAEHTGSFDGVRFSITPYTLGFAGRPGTDRQAYVDNLAAADDPSDCDATDCSTTTATRQ